MPGTTPNKPIRIQPPKERPADYEQLGLNKQATNIAFKAALRPLAQKARDKRKKFEKKYPDKPYYRIQWSGMGGVIVLLALIVDIVDLVLLCLGVGLIADEIIDLICDIGIPGMYYASGIHVSQEKTSLFPVWVIWIVDAILKAIPIIEALPFYCLSNIFIIRSVRKNDKAYFDQKKREEQEEIREQQEEEMRQRQRQMLMEQYSANENEEQEEQAEERNAEIGQEISVKDAYDAYQGQEKTQVSKPEMRPFDSIQAKSAPKQGLSNALQAPQGSSGQGSNLRKAG